MRQHTSGMPALRTAWSCELDSNLQFRFLVAFRRQVEVLPNLYVLVVQFCFVPGPPTYRK